MTLYTCGLTTSGPGALHPCAKAGNALDETGHDYEIKKVEGYRMMPWTWRSRAEDRKEVRDLSGQNQVPILMLDDGKVISGSGRIAEWARENTPAGV